MKNHKTAKTVFALAALVAIGGHVPALRADWFTQPTAQRPHTADEIAKYILSENVDASFAIQLLRTSGPAGIEALAAAGRSTLLAAQNDPAQMQSADWKRLADAFEKVGAQHDNWASQLYWFTDLEKAKAEAKKQNKPILSLRLLGNLDEELSCANSRFFRTALYPNQNISAFLRANFILHWQSERPVPKVTIDFGDGRKIETTITGNSIHYLLDSEGRVLDALPGLYGPGAFLRWISRGQDVFQKAGALDGDARTEYLKKFHQESGDQIAAQWTTDIGRASLNFIVWPSTTSLTDLGITGPPLRGTNLPNPTLEESIAQSTPSQLQDALKTDAQKIEVPTRGGVLANFLPTARRAAPLAVTKVIAEFPILDKITIAVPRDRNVLQRSTDDAAWSKIAALYAADARLDANSLRVLKTKTPRAQSVAETFQKSIAEDSVRNEFTRHTVIHQWLTENPNLELGALNKKVYSELFLTPDSDPWLGLLPADVYTGILNDGVSQ